jgi:hypothetical protein
LLVLGVQVSLVACMSEAPIATQPNADAARSPSGKSKPSIIPIAASGTPCTVVLNQYWWASYTLSPSICPTPLPHRGIMISFQMLYGPQLDTVDQAPIWGYPWAGAYTTTRSIRKYNGSWYTELDISWVAGTLGAYDNMYVEDDSHKNAGTLLETITYTLGAVTSISGTLSPPAGTSSTWSAAGTGPDPVTYQWYRNDTLVTGATAAQYSYTPPHPGPFTLKLDTRDQTTQFKDSATISPSAVFNITLNGPTNVNTPGGNCTWSVTNVGGAPPIHYVWTWNGVNQNDNTPGFNTDVSLTNNSLTVQVSDNNGNQNSIARTVRIVTSGGSTCVQ